MGDLVGIGMVLGFWVLGQDGFFIFIFKTDNSEMEMGNGNGKWKLEMGKWKWDLLCRLLSSIRFRHRVRSSLWNPSVPTQERSM